MCFLFHGGRSPASIQPYSPTTSCFVVHLYHIREKESVIRVRPLRYHVV
jgi:hypothetical protein